jgi:hypothetical protein
VAKKHENSCGFIGKGIALVHSTGACLSVKPRRQGAFFYPADCWFLQRIMSFGVQQIMDQKLMSIDVQSTAALRRNIAECEALKKRTERQVNHHYLFNQQRTSETAEKGMRILL